MAPLKRPSLPYPKIHELQDIVWNLRKTPFKQEWERLIVNILIHYYR